jgi:hypothetical protein
VVGRLCVAVLRRKSFAMEVQAHLPTEDVVTYLVPRFASLHDVAIRLCGELEISVAAADALLLEDATSGRRLSDLRTPLEELCEYAARVHDRGLGSDVAADNDALNRPTRVPPHMCAFALQSLVGHDWGSWCTWMRPKRAPQAAAAAAGRALRRTRC